MYFVLTVFAAALAISTAGPTTTTSPQVCPKPPSVNNATLADLTGALLYTKYYNVVRYDRDIDGMAYRFDRQGDSNSYTVTITRVYYGGSKKEEILIWKEYPAENKLGITDNNIENMIYYSIPYLEKNKSSVLYLCGKNGDEIRQFTQVLTSNLDNDLTKAVEEARKIVASDLFELPYKFKNAFLS